MPRGKTATLEEMPVADLRDAMANYERVSLKVTRRNEKGQIATVYSDVNMTLNELLDLDGWLKSNAGGGRFRIEVRDPQDKSKYVIPPFNVGVEGPPRPPRFLGNPAHMGGVPTPRYDNPGAVMNPYNPNGGPTQPGYAAIQHTPFHGHQDPYQPPPPRWLAGVHPSQRGGYLPPSMRNNANAMPAPGATVASDALAIRQLEEQKAEARAQIAKLEEQNKSLQEKLDRMLDEMKSERERAREERHRLEMEQLRKEMELNRTQRAPQTDTNWLAALAPFAPVLTGMFQSRDNAASKSLEVQQAGLKTLMEATLAQSNKPDKSMEMFTNVIMPMILAEKESKGPKAQAELFNSMVENNLNQVAMMAQLIEAFANAGGDEPWYLPMVRETMGGIVGMTEAYMQGKGGLPGQRAPVAPPAMLPQPQPQQAMAQPPQQSIAYTTTEAAPQAPQNQELQEAQNELDAIEQNLLANATPIQRAMLSQLPDDFQTQEWRICTLHLHQTNDVTESANLIAGHLTHLIRQESLPTAFQDVTTNPTEALERVIGVLPVAKVRPDFSREVIAKIVQNLIEDGFVETAAQAIAETTPEEQQVAMA